MAVRLREADSIAAVAELQQHIAELEIQVGMTVTSSASQTTGNFKHCLTVQMQLGQGQSISFQ